MGNTLTAADIAAAVAQTKDEILCDVERGVVPADVGSFGDLHDHVDANTYGGICDDDGPWAVVLDDDEGVAAVNEVQGAVDAWIRGGGIREALNALNDAERNAPAGCAR